MQHTGFLTAAALAFLLSLGAPTAADTVTAGLSDAERKALAKRAGAPLFDGMGSHHHPVTTANGDAQRYFDQGLIIDFGFNHAESARSFRAAQTLDADCAMCYWGEALALGPNINVTSNGMVVMSDEDRRAAHAAIQKALALKDRVSEREQDYIDALAVRYNGDPETPREPLDEAYAEAMRKLHRKYPDDDDAASLFAESLMNTMPWDYWLDGENPKPRTREVLDALETVLDRNPDHPMAIHLYIHAVEASDSPARAESPADRLRGLVPGSGHLVHMPSHIFIRTGRYEEAAKANQRAITADESYFKDAPAPDFYSLYFLHNVHFLCYAAMMEGRYDTAIEAARKIEQRIPQSFLEDYVTIADGFMPTTLHVMLRFGKWDEILAEPEPPKWRLVSRAERHFARSVALSARGDFTAAREELRKLEEIEAQISDEWMVGNNKAKEVLAVAHAMAAGELAFHEGRREEAFRLLREAVSLEEALSYDEPPGWMQPVRHALGALLLADRQHEEAEEVYRADLVRHPNNAWSLLGLQQSLGLQGRVDEAKSMDAQVQAAWERADVKPVASCYCHPDALLSH